MASRSPGPNHPSTARLAHLSGEGRWSLSPSSARNLTHQQHDATPLGRGALHPLTGKADSPFPEIGEGSGATCWQDDPTPSRPLPLPRGGVLTPVFGNPPWDNRTAGSRVVRLSEGYRPKSVRWPWPSVPRMPDPEPLLVRHLIDATPPGWGEGGCYPHRGQSLPRGRGALAQLCPVRRSSGQPPTPASGATGKTTREGGRLSNPPWGLKLSRWFATNPRSTAALRRATRPAGPIASIRPRPARPRSGRAWPLTPCWHICGDINLLPLLRSSVGSTQRPSSAGLTP